MVIIKRGKKSDHRRGQWAANLMVCWRFWTAVVATAAVAAPVSPRREPHIKHFPNGIILTGRCLYMFSRRPTDYWNGLSFKLSFFLSPCPTIHWIFFTSRFHRWCWGQNKSITRVSDDSSDRRAPPNLCQRLKTAEETLDGPNPSWRARPHRSSSSSPVNAADRLMKSAERGLHQNTEKRIKRFHYIIIFFSIFLLELLASRSLVGVKKRMNNFSERESNRTTTCVTHQHWEKYEIL